MQAAEGRIYVPSAPKKGPIGPQRRQVRQKHRRACSERPGCGSTRTSRPRGNPGAAKGNEREALSRGDSKSNLVQLKTKLRLIQEETGEPGSRNIPVLSSSDAKRSIQSLKSRQKAGHRAEQVKIKLLKREKPEMCLTTVTGAGILRSKVLKRGKVRYWDAHF